MSLTHGFWSSIYLRLLQQLTLWTSLFQTFSWSLGQCSCFSFYHLAVLNLLCRNFFFCTSLKRGCSKLVLLVNCPFSPRSSSQHEDCVGAHGAPFGGTPHLAECSAVATLRFLVIFETGPPFYLVLGPTIVYPPDCKPHEGRDGVWLAQNCLGTWHTDCLKNGWEMFANGWTTGSPVLCAVAEVMRIYRLIQCLPPDTLSQRLFPFINVTAVPDFSLKIVSGLHPLLTFC